MGLSFQNQTLTLADRRTGRVDSILFSQVDHFRFCEAGGRPGARLETRNILFSQSRLKIGRVDSTGHQIGLTEEDAATLLMPKRGRIHVRTGRRDFEADSDGLLALRPGQRETSVQRPSTGEARAYFLILPYADLLAGPGAGTGAGRDAEWLFKGGLGAQLRGPAATRLRNYLGFAVEDLIATPVTAVTDRMIHGLLTLIDDLLHDLLDPPPDDLRASSRPGADLQARRIRLAMDILHARADEPLSIADVAKDLGMGIRSLQMLFLKTFGIGPREMLNQIRLDMARQRLMAAGPDAQVTSIALDSGFTHLGRFSEAYRRTYGERPSDTLHRKRSH